MYTYINLFPKNIHKVHLMYSKEITRPILQICSEAWSGLKKKLHNLSKNKNELLTCMGLL